MEWNMRYRTYPEYLRHPIYLAARAVAMRRAQGLCKCGAMASEVHHMKYPLWGTFDVPSNLRPICHACHCLEHGKDD
jgi:hypothetical protein